MADYFSEYSAFTGAKGVGLPSPADTPYETPAIIRSKRSSRVGSSREHSVTPPLPPDATEGQERSRDARYDPRRFTPTLHASLVSEILNLRRELDSKNHLVENLEATLSTAKIENEVLNGQLSESSREVRKAKQQVEQMEKGTFDAVEILAQERDNANAALEDMRSKLESAQKKTRQHDEDSVRTQSIWENEKEAWDNERRQLERRVHVTESRLRAVVEEMAAQQTQAPHEDDNTDETTFKDSGLGEGSDTSSIRTASPNKHRRNLSSISSFRQRQTRFSITSRTTAATPDLYGRGGNNLADELGIDEEEEYDNDESEQGEDDDDYPERVKRAEDSRRSSVNGEVDAKAKSLLSIALDEQDTPQYSPGDSEETLSAFTRAQNQDESTTLAPKIILLPEPTAKVVYVDKGYQPSPPPSPLRTETTEDDEHTKGSEHVESLDEVQSTSTPRQSGLQVSTPDRRSQVAGSPISPPQTPVVDGITWLEEKAAPAVAPAYSTASTQTDFVEPQAPKSHTPKRDSLSPPSFVPSIAIHPPSSRPSSPRPYVLPPGTKNASAQANLVWPCKDASVQTEEIRIDRRPVKLPTHLLPGSLLPSPTFQEPAPATAPRPHRAPSGGTAKIFVKTSPVNSIPTPPPALQSPADSSPEMSRNNSSKDLRTHPLKALPLPRPVLSPPILQGETFHSNGPLNRSSQYGVSQPKFDNHYFTDADQLSGLSDSEDDGTDYDGSDLAGSAHQLSRPPPGRFGLSEPPKAVPEDKEISPERRPDTADSYGAAPAPSVASSRANSQLRHARPTSKFAKSDARTHMRSPSFGSMASTTKSAPPGACAVQVPPPFPIPMRSSSRVPAKTHSEGSQSPTPYEVFASRGGRGGRPQHARQVSLRKVQSAAVIRNRTGRGSPTKTHRRRRRSPDLTPIQSTAFEGATPTRFPIPELPSPVKENMRSPEFDYIKGSVDITRSPGDSSVPRVSEETNLVDAIAGTMVGEWMWKYIRKRKSFGIGEDSSEFPVADQNGVVNMTTGHGTRHKRWVWLSPYERTIMWDTKQPTSGPALLGKKGRKLSIQSVLEVEDLTPLPKNPELSTAWKRSILILTPERALKFTTTTQERHGLWMTALAFLAQSSQLPGQIPQPSTAKTDIPPVPPIPSHNGNSIDGVPIKRHRASSFGRSKVRDSIKLAHGRRPDHLQQDRSQPGNAFGTATMSGEAVRQSESAEFPAVPRLYITTGRHQRKRSNTGPQHHLAQPMIGFRSFSSSAVVSSTASTHHRGVSSTNGSSYRPSVSAKSVSRGNSIASPDRPNFFEAVGTVRMEAFVDPNVRDGVLYVPAPPPVIGAPRRPRRGSGLSQSTVDKRRAGYVFDEDGMDPFKGF